MPDNPNPLIFLGDKPKQYPYSAGRGGAGKPFPVRDRAAHSQKLIQKLGEILSLANAEKQNREAIALPSREGIYLEFKSSPTFELLTKSLDSIRPDSIRLLNVHEKTINGSVTKYATVFIPEGQHNYFLTKLEEYATKDTLNGNPKNNDLINSIENIRLAVAESFWQSDLALFPKETPVWCEVWLRVDKSIGLVDTVASFQSICQSLGIVLKENQVLKFPERVVVLIYANQESITALIASTTLIAELRRAQETTRFWMNLSPKEQTDWVKDLQERMQVENSNVSICILDTGVNNGHPLIEPVLYDEDRHTYHPDWGIDDLEGHGTLMAGLATFGDLEKHLSHNLPVIVAHRLESVKILPTNGENDPDLYGEITIQAVSLAEIQAPQRNRIIVMAVGSKIDSGTGKPSSWSGAVDQIAFGTGDNNIKRLVILAAGNTDINELNNYPASSQSTSVESPGQSWNALTIGAYTEKNIITDPSFSDYSPIALFGGLSPFSTTSMIWSKGWAIKPDVVFEGGNAIIDAANFASECDDLSLLSTYYKPLEQAFYTFGQTSAASAKAAWFAAQIMTNYPDAWAETVRGLIIHSANWTSKMKEQFLATDKKSDYRLLMRTCGYGVPDLQKAISCLNNSLTYIVQQSIQPYTKRDGKYATNEMHLYQLPWPADILLGLGEMNVTLKITLSYFIDPSPGEIGWKDKYRYQSYGLRFDINTPIENQAKFVKRINAAIKEEDEDNLTIPSNHSQRWVLGKQNRDLGSIHSDYWVGTAVELAECNMVAIYPTIGWWRERHQLGNWDAEARYSLIISLETEDATIPIYESVSNLIRTKVEVQIS